MEIYKIANGSFTLTWPDGKHKTFRIKTQKNDSHFAPGKRVIALMTGSDNENSFTGFGFVDNNGVRIWDSISSGRAKTAWVYSEGKLEGYVRALWSLATEGDASRFYAKGYRLLSEERCVKCNRKLTNPLSIRNKIGPECSGRRHAKIEDDGTVFA